MAVYSYSKISTFEQCQLKYKFRYIDKIYIIERSIESFLGEIVHSALEWLYLSVKKNILPSIDEMIAYYDEQWSRNYNQKIISITYDKTPDFYYNKGIKFLIDYYLEQKPFNDNTLYVEKEIFTTLDEGGKYKIHGYIDRLSYDLNKGEYIVHDYKTSDSAPSQEKIENDRQLSLYSMAVKELFGKDKEVLLIWHYLSYKRRIVSRRNNEQLEDMKRQIIKVIDKIESSKDFPPHISRLCDWC
ncbi:MAG TPA: PD-(D/E)XK nuclease family protein, partial [Patescibacteria group bacterium]|nr:PD-(D/E)XK nuclease family protein [Patescibacteria group bacterium]